MKEIGYIYTMKEITNIVDAFSSIDNSCCLDEYVFFVGWKNREARARKEYITELFIKLNNINRWLKGDLEPYEYPTYEEVQEKKEERQKVYDKLCKELGVSIAKIDDKQEILPKKLKPQQETEREKEYFAKAIQAGLMKKDGENYKWLHNNGLQSSLGYFLKMVFNPKGTAQIHYKRMEKLFKVSRLDSAIDRALSVQKPQKWRKEIDVLFDD